MTLVVSGRAKFTQAQAVLESSLFQEYDCAEGAKFGINLTTLLECLQIFGPGSLAQTSVSMAYQEVSWRVVLWFQRSTHAASSWSESLLCSLLGDNSWRGFEQMVYTGAENCFCLSSEHLFSCRSCSAFVDVASCARRHFPRHEAPWGWQRNVKSSGALHVAQCRQSILPTNTTEHGEQQLPVIALLLAIPTLSCPDAAASSGALDGSLLVSSRPEQRFA